MLGIVHPLTGVLHERDGNGNILVTDGESQGLFTPEGRWISGELRECDRHLCNWIAGPQVHRHQPKE